MSDTVSPIAPIVWTRPDSVSRSAAGWATTAGVATATSTRSHSPPTTEVEARGPTVAALAAGRAAWLHRKMQRVPGSWWSLAHTASRPRARSRYTSAAASIPTSGPVKYTHTAVHVRADTAEASVRAGFMLMPDRGASRVMYVATSRPAQSPVRAAIRLLETVSTTSISTNEMAISAPKATRGPPGPGTVTA